jgi:acetylornithine deacetylase/succinyl-diaminopimelate desuccinylase-like protein
MQTRLETILARLIAIPSVTSNTAACFEIIRFVREELAPLGLHVTASAPDAAHPWFFATTRNTLTPSILLAAHLDVVPGPDAIFTMRSEDGKLYGRGTYDMKLAAACYIEFLKGHANDLDKLDIGVLFTTDEEIGGDSMKDIFAAGLRPGVVFIPDGGGDWQIEARAKGFFGMELHAAGRAAHGSRPWEGDNALHRIMDITQILRSEYPFEGPNGTTVSITSVTGGNAVNQIADTASALLDIRSFDDAALKNFELRAFELAAEHDAVVTINQSGKPVIFNQEHPSVKPFLQAFEAQRGEPARYIDSYGGSDARYFAIYDIPCIIMEPHGGGRHAEDEWLLASDLGEYYRLIETWLLAGIPAAANVTRQTVAAS